MKWLSLNNSSEAKWSETIVHMACVNNSNMDKQSNAFYNKSVTEILIDSLTSRFKTHMFTTQLFWIDTLLISLEHRHSILDFYGTNQLHHEWMLFMLHVILLFLAVPSQCRRLITAIASQEMCLRWSVNLTYVAHDHWSIYIICIYKREEPAMCWWIHRWGVEDMLRSFSKNIDIAILNTPLQ